MRWIPSGTFTMGSERFYPEGAPLRRVSLDGFWIDTTPVTNRQFAAFVEATGYVTVAQVAPDPKNYSGLAPEMARAGSLVFHKTAGPVDTANPANWWRFEFGADWLHPLGPDRDIDALGLLNHPVVQVAYADALAYAEWAGKDLPTDGTRISLEGELPINTNGGALSAGRMHAYGQVHEACIQLRGIGGERQVGGNPSVAALSTAGGPLAGCFLLVRE